LFPWGKATAKAKQLRGKNIFRRGISVLQRKGFFCETVLSCYKQQKAVVSKGVRQQLEFSSKGCGMATFQEPRGRETSDVGYRYKATADI
jgi:hypothetical protein